MKKKFFVYFLAAASVAGSLAAERETLSLTVLRDGDSLPGVRLELRDAVPYLSVSDVAKMYKAGVQWSSVENKAKLTFGRKIVELEPDSTRVSVEGVIRNTDAPALYDGGDLLVPVELLLSRPFTELSGIQASWDDASKTLSLSHKATVEFPLVTTYRDRTRVAVRLLSPFPVLEKKKPDSLQLTISGAWTKEPLRQEVNDTVVKSVTLKPAHRATKITVDLAEDAGLTEVSLLSEAPGVVIDVQRASYSENPTAFSHLALAPPAGNAVLPEPEKPPVVVSEPVVVLPVETPVDIPKPPLVKRVEPVRKRPVSSQRIIVIDPGHGGKDAGAIGRRGLQEKDITLKLAKALAAELKKKGNYKIYLTRDKDEFIPLSERVQLANDRGADLFLSVHCNASLDKDSTGFEMYFLSENATDEAAEAVARFENSVLALEKDSKKQGSLTKLLSSMTLNQYMNESSELCGLISEEVRRARILPPRGVKQASFVVLRGAAMPAVLLEAAFISNRSEEKMLDSRDFHRKMVRAVRSAVDTFDKRRWSNAHE